MGANKLQKELGAIKSSKTGASEAQEGCNLMRLMRDEFPEFEPYLLHIPNGGVRSPAAGRLLKLQGVKRGVPDYLLAYPSRGFGGLWIELKKVKGSYGLSEAQQEWFERLGRANYQVRCCKGAAEALKAVRGYLGED